MESLILNVIFFARLRELMGVDKLSLELDDDKSYTVQMVMEIICKQQNAFAEYVENENTLMIAINQTVSNVGSVVNAGDELAFFPPVTGG